MDELKLTDDAFKDGAWIWVFLFFMFLFGGIDEIDKTEEENRPD